VQAAIRLMGEISAASIPTMARLCAAGPSRGL